MNFWNPQEGVAIPDTLNKAKGGYMQYHYNKDRKASLLRLIPDIFSGKYKSVLYIGAKERRFHFGQEFRDAKFEITS